MSEELSVYSIQRTYILTHVLTPGKEIVTCDERIDIPTIESYPVTKAVVYSDKFLKIIPCIELAGNFLTEFKLEFEINEGVTLLPIEIKPGASYPLDNPYTASRYALVLPRGATGVKSCKIIRKATRKEVQHNFTFGIMPPPYNYDNALFGYLSNGVIENLRNINNLKKIINQLKLTTKTPSFASIELPKGAGKQTINIEDGVLFYNTWFSYPLSSGTTIHKPKITLRVARHDWVYTLSLNRTTNHVSIDLLTGMITVYADVTGDIIQQFKLFLPNQGFETLSFENFDDIDTSILSVTPKGARVE